MPPNHLVAGTENKIDLLDLFENQVCDYLIKIDDAKQREIARIDVVMFMYNCIRKCIANKNDGWNSSHCRQ